MHPRHRIYNVMTQRARRRLRVCGHPRLAVFSQHDRDLGARCAHRGLRVASHHLHHGHQRGVKVRFHRRAVARGHTQNAVRSHAALRFCVLHLLSGARFRGVLTTVASSGKLRDLQRRHQLLAFYRWQQELPHHHPVFAHPRFEKRRLGLLLVLLAASKCFFQLGITHASRQFEQLKLIF